jgi:hypothetical protein
VVFIGLAGSPYKSMQVAVFRKGNHRFSETGYCGLFGKHGSFKKYKQACKLSCYGLSPDAIADVLLDVQVFNYAKDQHLA